MTAQKPKILLSEGSSLSSREAITALGLAGHRVELVSSDPLCLGRFSRFVSRVHRAPASGADPDGYLAAVLDTVKTSRIDALLPVHEQAYLFAAARKQLPADLGIALADFEAFEQVQSKATSRRTVDAAGRAAAQDRVVRSADEFAASGPSRFSSRPPSAPRAPASGGSAMHAGAMRCWRNSRQRQALRRGPSGAGRGHRRAGTHAGRVRSRTPGRQPHLSAARRGARRRRRAQAQRRQPASARHRRADRTRAGMARRAVVRLYPRRRNAARRISSTPIRAWSSR